MADEVGLLEAILDAVHGEDEVIGGRAFTRLTSPVTETEVTTLEVESTLNFGEWEDGEGNGRVLINGEIIDFDSKTDTSFDTLTREVKSTVAPSVHPEGSIVWDFSQNMSALDHLRRGLFVAFARDEDLDTIARNLGLKKCIGVPEDTWRAFIKAIAYLPKQTTTAFAEALDVLFGPGNYELTELYPLEPFTILIQISIASVNEIRGKFFLNSGEPQATTGTLSVSSDQDVVSVADAYDREVQGVFKRKNATYPTVLSAVEVGLGRVVSRPPDAGDTDYYGESGFTGTTITLGTSPGASGTLVLVDYTAFQAHYLASEESSPMSPNGPLPFDSDTVRHDEDFYAYLSDVLASTRCLLDQIRAGGVTLDIQAM